MGRLPLHRKNCALLIKGWKFRLHIMLLHSKFQFIWYYFSCSWKFSRIRVESNLFHNKIFLKEDSLPQSVTDVRKILIELPYLTVIVINLTKKITMVILKNLFNLTEASMVLCSGGSVLENLIIENWKIAENLGKIHE